jgi:6-phosphogluconate dehydrogenase
LASARISVSPSCSGFAVGPASLPHRVQRQRYRLVPGVVLPQFRPIDNHRFDDSASHSAIAVHGTLNSEAAYRLKGCTMQVGIIGLGRMGGNIARRLIRRGHEAIVYDREPEAVAVLADDGAVPAAGVEALVRKLSKPRAIWVMLPAGEITEGAIRELGLKLDPGDVVIDGGNTFWKDDIRRAAALKQRGVHYVDVGTSGGVWGLERGYCLMIGGEKDIVDRLDPVFAALAPGVGNVAASAGRDGRDPRPERGYLHAGANGAGHFVKMVHNGIEYGLMQAYAEGFDILKNAGSETLPEAERLDLDIADIAEVWRRGSVITSWLLDLTASALAADPSLDAYSGFVEDSGEGRWTVHAAIDEAVPVNVLSAALFARFRSRREHTFAEKILSAMRKGFGGHVEPKALQP